LYCVVQYVTQLHVSTLILGHLQVYTLSLVSNVIWWQIYYFDDEISVIL